MAKTGLIVGGCIAAFIVLIMLVTVIWTAGTYNGLVNKDETIDNKWAQVANQYQRKIDLIPSLVAEVEKYKEFEAGTLSNITRLRTQWMEADPDEQAQTSGELDAALRSIILTYEAYPYLQSIQAVSDLMAQLEGTENRITVERMRYNDAVKDYNTQIRQFPSSLIANTFGFGKRSYFESDAAPEKPGM